jgi:hypothetical protein
LLRQPSLPGRFHLSSPGFLVFLMVILGNGMRYGLALFGEAVIGCLGASILIVWLRLPDYLGMFSVSAIFFLVFFTIIVLYSYSLTAKIERARSKLAHERNVDALTGMLNRRALMERAITFVPVAGIAWWRNRRAVCRP